MTPDPPPADGPLTADPRRCPDCLYHNKINTCGVLFLLPSDPDGPDCGSEAVESSGPEFFEDTHLHGMAHVMRESPHAPHVLFALFTLVNVYPPYYAEDPKMKVLLDWGIKKNIEYAIYRWHEPQWYTPILRWMAGH